MSWCQSTIATGHEHGLAEVFDPNYAPTDVNDVELFSEQKKFMFSVFLVTLKEWSTASLYDTYAIEGEPNCGDAQLIWHNLVNLFHEWSGWRITPMVP